MRHIIFALLFLVTLPVTGPVFLALWLFGLDRGEPERLVTVGG